MAIEVMTLITIVSIVVGVYGTVKGLQSSKTKEDKAEATENATIIAKLETINSNLLEVKNEMKSLKEETRKNSDSIIRMDESLKSAWKAINILQGKKLTEDDCK